MNPFQQLCNELCKCGKHESIISPKSNKEFTMPSLSGIELNCKYLAPLFNQIVDALFGKKFNAKENIKFTYSQILVRDWCWNKPYIAYNKYRRYGCSGFIQIELNFIQKDLTLLPEYKLLIGAISKIFEHYNLNHRINIGRNISYTQNNSNIIFIDYYLDKLLSMAESEFYNEKSRLYRGLFHRDLQNILWGYLKN
jgi:hypothetical protein